MRISIILLLVALPVSVSAFDFNNMGQGDMDKLMRGMQDMQNCMSNIDEGELETLSNKSEKFTSSIKSLCQQGLRAEAQKNAMTFAREMTGDKTLKKLQKCGEAAKGMMPDTSLMYSEKSDGKEKHVCDGIAE
ncbi:MAG: hypothetical protein OEM07_04195 [Gammaproteobacteria bacterium]|nr:hypothetical protein [Gammaproteobacteria bacterium]